MHILEREFRAEGTAERAMASARFFKTGRGQYGEGDRFLGIAVPVIRTYVKRYRESDEAVVARLLESEWHEERLLGLLIWVDQFARGDEVTRKRIFDGYIAHRDQVNNWDLVDSSAGKIVGAYLEGRDESVLYELAKSDRLWDRRIAMIASLHSIMRGDPRLALELAEVLLHDREDLMHKAVGWMLREVGKRCGREPLTDFLDRHADTMPRTTLRYAIEHFDAGTRKRYMLKGAASLQREVKGVR